MRWLAALIGLVLGAAGGAGAQGLRPSPTALRSIIADIEAGRRTTPWIGEADRGGDVAVIFFARRGRGPIPRIVSDVGGWGEQPDESFSFRTGTMRRAGIGDWYYLACRVAPRARIEYLIARGLGRYETDPYNPRQQAMHGAGAKSEFVLPGYRPPPSLQVTAERPAGRIEPAVVPSRALGPWPVSIYTPPGYDPNRAYPLAVSSHGTAMLGAGQAGQVLEWLADRKMVEPLIFVAVAHVDGQGGLPPDASLLTFLTEELPAWLSSRYRISPDPGRRAIFGISYSARDALEAALTPGQAYGGVGLLIPGRRLRPELIDELAARPVRPVRAFILGGLYDAPNLATARRLRARLERRGDQVEYLEVPEGHNAATWRHHLADAFLALFGKTAPSSILPRSS